PLWRPASVGCAEPAGGGDLAHLPGARLDHEQIAGVAARFGADEDDLLAVRRVGAWQVVATVWIHGDAGESTAVVGGHRVDAVESGVGVVPALAGELGIVWCPGSAGAADVQSG